MALSEYSKESILRWLALWLREADPDKVLEPDELKELIGSAASDSGLVGGNAINLQSRDGTAVDIEDALRVKGALVTNVSGNRNELDLGRFDVREFGATGDGVTDDSAAIRLAIAAADAVGGGYIYFPAGTYVVSRDTAGLGSGTAFGFAVPSNIHFVGAGQGITTIKQGVNAYNAGAFFYMFVTDGDLNGSGPQRENISWRGISFDGNKDNQANHFNKHQHAIFLTHCTGIVIDDCEFFNFVGDGVDFWWKTYGATVTRCNFHDNERDGVALTADCSDITIRDCSFWAIYAAAIDFEQNNPGNTARRVLIDGNRIFDAPEDVSISILGVEGSGDTELAQDIWVTNNYVEGSIWVISTDGFVIRDNVFRGISFNLGAGQMIHLQRTCKNGVIQGNVVYQIAAATAAAINVAGFETGIQENIKIVDNTIYHTASSAIAVSSVKNCEIVGNTIYSSGTLSGNVGISVRTPTAGYDTENLRIAGNKIHTTTGMVGAISVLGSTIATTRRLTIENNVCTGPGTHGIYVQGIPGAGYLFESLTIGSNHVDTADGMNPLYIHDPKFRIAEVAGCGIYGGNGAPEGVVTAAPGSLYYQLDGAGSAKWTKQSGTSNAGWVQDHIPVLESRAALKALGTTNRYHGMQARLVDDSNWKFDGASSAEDTTENLVVTPTAGTGRWLRADPYVNVQLAADFNTADAAVLFTVPSGFRLRPLSSAWEVVTSWSGGASSAIGLSSNNANFSTKGDLLGGASGDVAAELVTSNVFAGTAGAKIAQPKTVLRGGNTIRFDRITSAFTAGAGIAHIGMQVLANGTASDVVPFVPASGLAFWGDADPTYLTLTGSDVDVWTDRNGSGRTLVPTGVNDKPAAEAAGLNGLPCVRFDLANTEALYSTSAGLGDLPSGTNEAFTIVAAMQYVTVPAAIADAFAWGNSASNNAHIQIGHSATGQHTVFKRNDASTTADVTASEAADTSAHVYTYKSTGTAATVYIDGVATSINATAQSAGAQTLNRFSVGAVMKAAPAAYGNIRVPEFLVFDSALSDADRVNAETYLRNRYGLQAGNHITGPLDVIVIAGQSNALGAASATGQIFSSATRYLRHDVGVSEPSELAALGPSPTNTFGVERELVEDMKAAGRTVAVIKCARSSTLIADWQSGGTYGVALRAAHALGISLLNTFYSSPVIRTHFVWIHGEQDGLTSGNAAAYEGALRTFLAGLDTYWGTSVHAHVLQLSNLATLVTHRATVQAGQATVAAEEANYHLVDPGASGMSGDNLHFSAAGYNSLGALLATSILGTIP